MGLKKKELLEDLYQLGKGSSRRLRRITLKNGHVKGGKRSVFEEFRKRTSDPRKDLGKKAT